LFISFFPTVEGQYLNQNSSNSEGEIICLLPEGCGLPVITESKPLHENQFFVFIIFAGVGIPVTIFVLFKHKQK
jgi:hypothetical protein